MNDQALVLQQQAEKPLTVAEMVAQVSTIQHMLAAVMHKDVHYGVIPGTKAPSLYKPGAEKIMMTFRLAADPVVEDLAQDDLIRYRVQVRLISPSGRFIGAGVGECSSNEEKYCWRNAVCDEEWEETPLHRRREKWRSYWAKGGGGKRTEKVKQVRTQPADLANTILKMAKKRALVDAVLTATAASDLFTQDLEDLPQEWVASQEGEGPPRAAAAAPPPGVARNAGQDDPATQDLVDSLTETAQQGWDALQKQWAGLTEDQRRAVGTTFRTIKEIALKMDGGEA